MPSCDNNGKLHFLFKTSEVLEKFARHSGGSNRSVAAVSSNQKQKQR